MPAHLLITAFVWTLACAATLRAAPEEPLSEDEGFLKWTGVNGAEVRAKFVRKDGDKVVLLLTSGIERPFPLASLSPQSAEQAIQAEKCCYHLIPKGRFTMGSPLKEPGRIHNPAPAPPPANAAASGMTEVPEYEPEHPVTISRDFWLRATEVTWEEWNIIREKGLKRGYDISPGQCGYGANVSKDHPVTCITWLDAVKWCNAKSESEHRTAAYFSHPDCSPDHILTSGDPLAYMDVNATGYRLPTEAEWEYACRERRKLGGPAFHSGHVSSLGEVCWYADNSKGATHPVGTMNPNELGLFDMHGNVSEWCWDFLGALTTAEAIDPVGTTAGVFHIFRGGSWADPSRCCRSAYRSIYSPSAPLSPVVGFRPACGSDPRKPAPPTPPAKPSKVKKAPGK
ncbi:MAG: formylglycine-generating enzyme family protein [Verrucomicrobiota bacterium]